jgi:hypothetical protein
MPEAEKRKSERRTLLTTTIVRRAIQADGGMDFEIMEFRTRDISSGGIFISTEDLSIFQLGDEVEVLVDDGGERYYEGRARVVRSARIFSEEGNPVESGFGLMFLMPDFEVGLLAEHVKE